MKKCIRHLAFAIVFSGLISAGGCTSVRHVVSSQQTSNKVANVSTHETITRYSTNERTSSDIQSTIIQAAAYTNETLVDDESAPLPVLPSMLTLAEIEQIALKNNPAILAANLTSAMASGLRQQVGVRANPTVGYWGSQLVDKSTEQNGAFIHQEFVRGNKLAFNRNVLAHTLNAQRWEAETQRYRVLTDVRMRFFEALAAQRQLEATIKFAIVAERGVEVAIARQDAKEGTIIEVLQSRTLMSEIKLAEEQTQAAYLGAWKDLAAIAGTPDMQPVTLVAEFASPTEIPNWENAYMEITSQSPELAAAKALVCEKKANRNRQLLGLLNCARNSAPLSGRN